MAQRTMAPELPGFTYLGWIGGGGFADVFRYQDALGRSVAVKVQHRGVDAGTSAAFEAEAALMAKLSTHPNIVTILQSGVSSDGRPFMVMEECAAAHLGARIAKRTQTTSKTMEVIIQVAGAVETAHRMGILHRDIKPANILFTDFGRPALTDFGISVGGGQTQAGAGLSPLWAPPEQHPNSDKPMGPWSDVFSLAATMWAMLVGRSPLEVPGGANDQLSLRHRVRTFNPPPTGRQDVPDMLERVLATALARDPAQRYASALEFARAIQGVQGQMNESVTPVDVLADDVEDDHDEESLDTGTRVSGFMLIDPDEMPGSLTVTTTGPGGGVTSPHDRSQPTGGQVPAAFLSQPIAQHGRGYGAPGIRDFTGPVLPEYADRTAVCSPANQGGVPVTETRSRKGASLVAVLASVLIVLLVGGGMWGLWASGVLNADPVTASTSTDSPTVKAQDPVGMRVPPVEDIKGTKSGDTVTFGWANPDPSPSDKYLVEELSTGKQEPYRETSEPTITVPAQPGQTCINVTLRRGNGQVSAPVRGCVDS